jgi:DNA-binding CsgD family transcriptional regulator/predicted DNA-binding protein YlxM (UPF0122 family)
MVASRLNRTDAKIGEEMDIRKSQVRHLMKSLFAITGVRTRTELALMARVYDFGIEPGSPDEVADMFEGYKPSHRTVLENLHLPIEEIVDKAGIERDAVDGVMHRCEEKTGTNKRIALALELQRRGVKYDIRKPKGPLAEVLSFAEWQVAESLTLSNEDIAEVTKYDPDSISTIIYRIRLKIGARTRTEIALMMVKYDTGERPKAEPTPRERLKAKLGEEALSDEELVDLLEETNDNQRYYISAFYLRDAPTSWEKVAEEAGKSKTAPYYVAERGILKMRMARLARQTQEQVSSNGDGQEELSVAA